MLDLLTQKIQKLTKRQIIGIFSAVGLLIYLDSLFNQMYFDDIQFILKNIYVHSWRYLGYYFTKDVTAGAGGISNYWRPILSLVFSIEWHLWRNWVVGYHLVNTTFHILDAVLLFYLFERLIKNRWISFLVSMIFLVHPIQTESVTYVNSLGDSLSVFFMLAAFHYYLNYYMLRESISIGPKIKSLVISLVLYCLGIMSKETAIILSALIFTADFLLLQKAPSFFPRLWNSLKRAWTFFAITIVYLVMRATVINFQNSFNFYKAPGEYGLTTAEAAFSNSLIVRFYTFLSILPKYLSLIFYPIRQLYQRPVAIVTSIQDPNVILGLIIFSFLLILGLLIYKKQPVVTFGVLWFFIAIAPTSNVFVPINGIMYEHWLYLPLVGLCLAVIWILLEITKSKKIIYAGIIFATLFFICALGVRAAVRNRDWKDDLTFYTKILESDQTNTKVLLNLGTYYAEHDQLDKAEELFKQGLAIRPSDNNMTFNLGNAYLQGKKYDLAIDAYKRVLSFDPGYLPAYQNLFSIYLTQKKYTEMDILLNDWLKVPTITLEEKMNLYILIGKTAVQLNDYPKAILYLDEALLLDPNNPAIQDLIEKAHYLRDNPQAK
jgi:hypothetical protein